MCCSSFFYDPVFWPKVGLYLIPLQSLCFFLFMVTNVFNKPAISVLIEVIGAGLWVGYVARLNG